jgi:ATP-binding cassette subfamily B multidrug efflux pump
MREFLTLNDFFKNHKWYYIFGILGLIAVDFLQLIPPQILGSLADMFQEGSLTVKVVQNYALWLVVIAVAIGILRFSWRYLVQKTARSIETYLRDLLYSHLQTLDSTYYDHHRIGDLMAHATNDVSSVRTAFSLGLVMIVDASVLTIATVILMFRTIDTRLVLLSLLPLPLVAVAATLFSHPLHKRFLQVQETFSKLTENVQENISGIRVIISYAQEKFTAERFRKINQLTAQVNIRQAKLSSLIHPLVNFLASLSFLIVLGYGGLLILRQETSLGSFVKLNSYLAMLTWPMMALGWVFSIIQRGIASQGRINSILNTKPQIVNAPDAIHLPHPQGNITINNLTFNYPESPLPALQNISLQLEQGQTLGIVGRTGSGKSTLVNLLLRLYDPPEDTIFLDGHDISKLKIESLRGAFGYVPQDAYLFSTTVKANILFGREATTEELNHILEVSQFAKDLPQLPQGLETIVGERGVSLSGGQKQRIAIARALLGQPPILIFDDALSAVDTKTEEAILQRLKNETKNRTTIMISHRISSIRHGDQIIYMDKGKILEQGTHQELLAKKGAYFELYEKQLLEDELTEFGRDLTNE